MEERRGFALLERGEIENWVVKHDVYRVINLIQNHHTLVPDMTLFNGHNHFSLLTGMKNHHVSERRFSDIAQNITTFPDGKIAMCRRLDVPPAGIKEHNTRGICIEHLGNFDKGKDSMTQDHKDSIVRINAVLCHKFNLIPNTKTIVYHHWYDLITCRRTDGTGTTKSCPGTDFFGGNTVTSAEQRFIPLIVSELRKVKRGTSISIERAAGPVLGHAIVLAAKLNIRGAPSAKAKKYGFLPSGCVVAIYKRMGGWCRISGKNRWVSGRYLRDVFFGRVSASSLNVRAGPGKEFRIIGGLSHGEGVIIHETKNGWHKIGINEKWVFGQYVNIAV